ncbi:hypothetical protein Tco_0683994 [Tanacetum coccineum]
MNKYKSFNKSPKHRALYHALMESILEDEDAMDKGIADELKKRKPDDADKDEGPTAGSDRGLKRQRTSKGTKTSNKKSTSKDSSKGKSPTTSSKSGKSAKDQVEEPIFAQDSNYAKHDDVEFDYADMPMDHGEYLATKPPLNFDELMHTLIDFSAFAMNRLNIDNLTKEYLNNPEGHRCPYDLTKPLPVQMPSQGGQIFPVDFFFNNDLEYLRGRSNDKKYTASTTKSKAARHDVYSTKRILSIIRVKVNEWYGYGHLVEIVVKRVDQKLYTFNEGDFKRLHLNDIEDMLLLARVEDLQLGVESYQKKLNLTKPRTQDVDMSHRPTDVLSCRADELHKFSDGTLISLCDTLDQMLHELYLGYNIAMRRRIWSRLDQQRTRIMIKAINQKLLDRQIMRSLEKFVSGRDYGEDLILL